MLELSVCYVFAIHHVTVVIVPLYTRSLPWNEVPITSAKHKLYSIHYILNILQI